MNFMMFVQAKQAVNSNKLAVQSRAVLGYFQKRLTYMYMYLKKRSVIG